MTSGNNPEFSIVIPVRNGDPYLREALDSIFKQSYPRFRILILENCSQDNTLSIINAYQDPRISVFPANSALSIEANWARILDLNLSEYMTVMGHDDVLYPDFLQETVQLITEYPDASLYQTHFHLIDEHGEIFRNCKPMPGRESAEGFLKSKQSIMRDSFGTGYVMRSIDYKRIGGLPAFPKLICADDVAWYKLAQISYISCSPEYLFGYRYHRGSTSFMIDMPTLYAAFKRYWSFLSESDYFTSSDNVNLAQRYLSKVLTGHYHRVLVDTALSSDSQGIKQYKEMKEHLLAEVKEDNLFSVYDLLSTLLECLLYIQPSSLRRAMATELLALADAKQKFRKSR